MENLKYTELLKVYRELKKTKCKKFYIFTEYMNDAGINENFPDVLRIMLDVEEYDFQEKYNFKINDFRSKEEVIEIVKLLLNELKEQGARAINELYFTIDKRGNFVSKLQHEEDYFNRDVDTYFPDSVKARYKEFDIRCMRREAKLFNLQILE